MTVAHSESDKHLTAEEFLAGALDALSVTAGDVEVVEGRVVRLQAQSLAHSRVVRRLAQMLEDARDPAGPCMQVASDVAVRFPDTEDRRQDRRLNVQYPDILIWDCEPYDVGTIREHILLIAEVVSKDTVDTDTGPKRALYARSGIPVYLVIIFDKSWETIDRIEEYRLDWSGLRYMPHKVHRTGLILDDPVTLAVTFDRLDRP